MIYTAGMPGFMIHQLIIDSFDEAIYGKNLPKKGELKFMPSLKYDMNGKAVWDIYGTIVGAPYNSPASSFFSSKTAYSEDFFEDQKKELIPKFLTYLNKKHPVVFEEICNNNIFKEKE